MALNHDLVVEALAAWRLPRLTIDVDGKHSGDRDDLKYLRGLEVRAVIQEPAGTPRLMAVLMYGAGLRLLEWARLRVPSRPISPDTSRA